MVTQDTQGFILTFMAKEIKKGDCTRFKNLFNKLKVKIEMIKMPNKLKGRKIKQVIMDEASYIGDKIWKHKIL